MAYDAHKNLAYSTIATAPSPAASGGSLVVFAGDGTKFPAASFNAIVWPANTQPTTSNAEIVRVTVIATDTFTVTRAQEGTAARTIIIGDQIAATITAKTITDIEGNLLATVPAGTSGGVPAYTASGVLTSSGALTAHGVVIGGGAGAVPTVTAVGATGSVLAGNTGADPTFQTAASLGASLVRLTCSADSGTDASAGATSVATCAISGLTAKDSIKVVYTIESIVAATANVLLYSTTDAVTLVSVSNGGAVAINQTISGEGLLRPRQGSTTAGVGASWQNGSANALTGSGGNFTITDWTGNWTLALRHSGVTATGTFKWTWSVYKIAGQ